MSIETSTSLPIDEPQLPLGRLLRLYNDTGLSSATEFVIDASMPYEGSLYASENYIIVGGNNHAKPDQTPQLRGRLEYKRTGDGMASFTVSDFYAREGDDMQALAAIGMPRYRDEDGVDHPLPLAPCLVRSFGVSLDFKRQIVGITALPERGAPYGVEFDAAECHFPDHVPAGNADVAYRIGVVAMVVSGHKFLAQSEG